MSHARTAAILMLGAAFARPALCTSYIPHEPVELKKLLAASDIVATVWITGGDATACVGGVYRAEVVDAIKGTRAKEILFFNVGGDGLTLGHKYVVFLDRAKQRLSDCPKAQGVLPWQGLSAAAVLIAAEPYVPPFPIEYTRSLPGEESGVRIPGGTLLIPPDIAVSRDTGNPEFNGDLWVREWNLLKVLTSWAKQK